MSRVRWNLDGAFRSQEKAERFSEHSGVGEMTMPTVKRGAENGSWLETKGHFQASRVDRNEGEEPEQEIQSEVPIDEILVSRDLEPCHRANLDLEIRDGSSPQVDIAENVFLAVRLKIYDVRAR